MITKKEYKDAQLLIKMYEHQEKILNEERNSNPDCALNRLPKNCSIFQNVSGDCSSCGHDKTRWVFKEKTQIKTKIK